MVTQNNREYIAADFEAKKATYFRDNYLVHSYRNANRRRRRDTIARMINMMPTIERFLDMGCGPTVLFPEALAVCDAYFAADIAPSNLASIQQQDAKIRTVRLDLDAFSWDPDFFDIVVCSGSLEYCDNGLANLEKVLPAIRQGGMFICSFPNSQSPYRIWHESLYLPASRTIKKLLKRPSSPYYRTLFSKRQVQKVVEVHGFGDIRFEHVGYDLVLPPLDSWFPRIAYGAEVTLRRTMPRVLSSLTSEFIVSVRRLR